MSDNLPIWANIAQIISLPIAVIALILQIADYVYPKTQIAQAISKVRPFLPYIIVSAISFWLGSYIFGRTQNEPTVPRPDLQETVIAINSTSVAQAAELQTARVELTNVASSASPPETAPAVTAVTAVTAITQVSDSVQVIKETVEVIRTVEVTVEVPVVVTPTETPVLPLEGDTPVESVLSVGDTWKSRGAEFTLQGYTPYKDQICTSWRFVNNTGQDLIVRYSSQNFVATDAKTGQQLEVYGFYWSGYTYSLDDILKDGEVAINNHKEGTPGQIGALCIKLDPRRTSEVFITTRDISSRIKEAKWKVALNLN
jgi:hypothetical protein